MEIRIKIPSQVPIKQRLEVDEDSFEKDLKKFVDQLENYKILNEVLYNKFLEVGINQKELDSMIKEIRLFSSYDENLDEIGFPYENWLERLLIVYETKEMTDKRVSSKSVNQNARDKTSSG
jgi:hypothetical protein